MNAEKENFAEEEAREICRSFKDKPADLSARLHDLKLATVTQAEVLCDAEYPEDFAWRLAQALPDYTTDGLYETRASLWGIGAAVLVGWLLGGLLSTLLNFAGLGGDILRPLAIFGLLLACDYLASNPAARRTLLALFGLGALTRIAAGMAAGAIRGFGALRAALGAISAGPGRLRLVWLWGGALLLFVFFSRRTGGINLPQFQENLTEQIEARLRLCCFILTELTQAKPAEPAQANPAESRANRELAAGVISLLPSLAPKQASWLAELLSQAGYETSAPGTKYLFWDPEQHQELYDTIGLVSKGDHCLILKPPFRAGDTFKRGLVQRVAE